MTIEEVMRLTPKKLEKMSRSELARTVSVLASAANKRIKRIEKSGITSPAYDYIRKSGKISVSGKDVDALMNEFVRAKGFLKAKTSTVSGAKKVKVKTLNAFKKAYSDRAGESFDVDDSEFWKFFSGRAIDHAIDAYFGGYKGWNTITVAKNIFKQQKQKYATMDNPPDEAKQRAAFRRAFRNAAKREYEESQDYDDSDYWDYPNEEV